MRHGAHSRRGYSLIGILFVGLGFTATVSRAELLISVAETFSAGQNAVRRYNETTGAYLGSTGSNGGETIGTMAVRQHKDLFVEYHDISGINIQKYDVQSGAFLGAFATLNSDPGGASTG